MSRVLSHKIRFLFLVVFSLMFVSACVPDATAAPDPTTTSTTTPTAASWDFTIKVDYSSAMVARYGGEAALQTKVRDQLHTIEGKFTGFSKTITFTPVSFSVYSGSPVTQASLPHPQAELLLVYTEELGVGGGWDGASQALLHSWYENNSSGVLQGNAFAPNGTDGMKHELGHFRGAIDTYAVNVVPDKDGVLHNPISSSQYRAETSFMDYPYDNDVLDVYSHCIIERSADVVGAATPVVANTLPSTFQVLVTSPTGTNITGASVKLYPVAWFSNAVTATPVMTGMTGANGVFQLPSNPFRPLEVAGAPWGVVAGNFLIEVKLGAKVSYGWLPVTAAGFAACNYHADLFAVSIVLG